jgi:hypothetical protein
MGAIFFGSILMQDFFIAEGDGLPRGVVENAAAPVKHVLSMYSLDTNEVIETFKHMSEQMVGGHESTGRQGPHSSLDSDKLLRILCHRNDQVASKFLKKQYKLSST